MPPSPEAKMAYEFKFPDIGEGLTEGEIVEWKVKVGDKVADHQIILEVETDKAVAEVPSPRAGYVTMLKGEPGDVIEVGEVIAVIDDKPPSGEKAAPAVKPAEKEKPAPKPEKKPPEGEKPEKKPEPKPAGPVEKPPAPAETFKVKRGSVGVVGELEEAPEEEVEEQATPVEPGKPAPISRPRVDALPKDRMLARQIGVDIEKVRGTGPRGRVTEEDVRKASGQGAPEKGARVEAAGAPGEDTFGSVERVPVRGVRRKVAQMMVDSLTRAAQVTTTDEADVGLLSHIRDKEKAKVAEQGAHLTFLPFIVKAVVSALRRDPYMNSAMDDEKSEIVVKGYYNIGIAVETQDGLIVPNVKEADKKSIVEIAKDIESLSEKARKRTLDIRDLKGGTFTITNYGSIGGIFGTPVLNYPEVGILGVGRIADKPAVVDGAIKIKKMLPLSLTFDHRVVDGATAQHFLNNVIRALEDPDIIFVGI
jgi:pyruvate dehydrogenase E2 component (dihydrolipoamide acetyltransferase)